MTDAERQEHRAPISATMFKMIDGLRKIEATAMLLRKSLADIALQVRGLELGCDIDTNSTINICRSCGRDGPAIGECPKGIVQSE